MREPFIAQVNETVFLRVVLDDNLTWKSHISGLADEISKSINMTFRSSFLSFNFFEFFSHAM